ERLGAGGDLLERGRRLFGLPSIRLPVLREPAEVLRGAVEPDAALAERGEGVAVVEREPLFLQPLDVAGEALAELGERVRRRAAVERRLEALDRDRRELGGGLHLHSLQLRELAVEREERRIGG